MGQEFDLWGDPVAPPTEKRGRPEHQVTTEKRLRVSVLRATNHTADEIAAALGISTRTLRAKYLPELKHGLAQKRAETLVRLWKAVEKGNVSAMREMFRQIEKSDLQGPRAAQDAQPQPRARALGKKEQAAFDAANPDTTSTMGELMARRANRSAVH